MSSHDPYAALRSQAFRSAFLTHVLSITATQMQSTTVGWLLYERTHSPAVLGLLGLSIFLPVLCCALPVGHIVDRHPRRHSLIIGQSILILVALGLTSIAALALHTALIIVLTACAGVGLVFMNTARPALMREAIGAELAENGASWSSLGRRIASVTGPILSGGLIALSGGAALAFLSCALLLSAALLATMRIAPTPQGRSDEPLSIHTLLQGLRFIRRTPLILSTTLLDMCAVLVGGATGLLPVFAKDILHVGPIGLGILTAAPALGSGLCSLVLLHRPPLQRAGRTLLLTIAGFGISTIIFGISRSPALSLVALMLIGAFDSISVTIRSTILQVHTPDWVRGRVYGVNMIFIYASNELGDFESGMVASLLGATPAVILGGMGAMAIAGVFGMLWPELRGLQSMAVHGNNTHS